MRKRADGGWKQVARMAAAVAACIGVLAGGIAVQRLLADETTHARAFVAEGQRALAAGDRGAGVLALERARWLAPRADLVRSALSAAGVKDAESVLPRTLRLVTSPEWAAIAIAAGWASGLGVAFVVARRRSRTARWVALAGGAAFVVAMAADVETNTVSLAIVTGAHARVLVAPYPTATVEEPLVDGTMVKVGSPYDDFVRIDDGHGTKGWARRSSIVRIASPES